LIQLTQPIAPTDQQGFVVKTQSSFYWVQPQDPAQAVVVCKLRGTLKQAEKKTELCVIGDHVTFIVGEDGQGSIKHIHPRQRVLSRVEPSGYAGTAAEREQVIIANPDQAVFVFAAANPALNRRLLDRCLVAAEKAEIPHIAIILNKTDLITEAESHHLLETYQKIGYTTLGLSASKKHGIEALRTLLSGKISVFTGPSGVGKSSLLNAMQPGLGQAVGEVSQKLSKGKHTTVNGQMFALEGGGYVADTPGIRTLALWDVEPNELDGYYPEFRQYVGQCRFNNCTHSTEQGCALLEAVQSGKIDGERHDSYLRLRRDLAEQYVY
jgi:ribosome biogenesis GTPase / thiamine phosphate phosphatase